VHSLTGASWSHRGGVDPTTVPRVLDGSGGTAVGDLRLLFSYLIRPGDSSGATNHQCTVVSLCRPGLVALTRTPWWGRDGRE
jgi:hypothetical protein